MQVSTPPPSTARAQRLLVLCFLLFLAAPWLDLRPASVRGPDIEGRNAMTYPPWDLRLLSQNRYMKRFELAFSDSLGLRDILLRWHSWIALELLAVSPTPTVLVGKQGWLFYTEEASVETWRGLNPLSTAQLAAWQHVIEVRRDHARLAGAEYFFVLGPNKESIYPDYLPAGYEPLGPSRLDQLAAWMQAHSDVQFVDLRPCLRAARAQDTPQHVLYYEEGTHWHGRGCMAAAQEILRRIGERIPAVAALPKTVWRMESEWPPETWRTKMYLDAPRSRLRDEWRQTEGSRRARPLTSNPGNPLQHYAQVTPAPELPVAVMFHDSFGPGIANLLAEPFARFITQHGNRFDDELIGAEHPALVIDLFVERLLAIPDAGAFLPRPIENPALAQLFDRASEVRMRCDAGTPAAAFETSGQLSIEARNSPPSPGLLLRCAGPAGALTLPPIQAGPERDLVLRLVLTCPIASQATLYFAGGPGEAWSEDRSRPLQFERGRNSLDVRFAAGEQVQRLRLRPGQTAGATYVLHSAEVRAVEPR
jgi:hypothetical protein